MLSKEAQEKVASTIDRGYIEKCAEFGLNWNDPEDKKVITDLMNHTLQEVNSGKLYIDDLK